MLVSNLCRRIIPCLDVAGGRTVKGIKFGNLRDVGDPVEQALEYERQGADELVFLDIRASHEGRSTQIELVERIAHSLSIPFTIGGGISALPHVRQLLESGADKVSVNTAAVNRPELIEEIATACGSQCCVLAVDARAVREENGKAEAGKWEVLTHGGRTPTGIDVLEWIKRAVGLGAGEILLTSWDRDGTKEGFDIELTRAVSNACGVPVIASGGADSADSFIEVFTEGEADAALAASIFHDGIWTIGKLKEEIARAGIQVRQC